MEGGHGLSGDARTMRGSKDTGRDGLRWAMDSPFLVHARLPDNSVSMLLACPPPPDRRDSMFLARPLDRVLELMRVCHP